MTELMDQADVGPAPVTEDDGADGADRVATSSAARRHGWHRWHRWGAAAALILLGVGAVSANVIRDRSQDMVPPPQPTGVEATAGAAPSSAVAYPIPGDAVYVSAAGKDGASGTAVDPLRTVWAGIDKAAAGGTVVIRGGSYHETVTIPPEKRLTVQSSPHENVLMDGSSPLTAWHSEGSMWSAPWLVPFDHSPTYTWGAPESSLPGWQFVDPAHPLAAHPEQLWVDGVSQRQVGSREDVTAGSFFVDETGQRVVLGTDPTSHLVEVTTLRQALVVQAPDSTVRGISIRRYADSVPHQGVLTVLAPHAVIENVVVDESSTTGIGVLAADATVRHVTVSRSGMLGVAANQADRSTFSALRLEANNTEHFNHSPAAGGLKATKSQQVTIADSDVSSNDGTGLWVDESSSAVRVVGNDVRRNLEHGIVFEISAEAVVADNRVSDNAGDGILVVDSGHVEIWNNTVTGDDRSINLTQDGRDPRAPDALGRDPRAGGLRPQMDWQLASISVHNNILGLPREGTDTLLGVEDYTKQRRAEDLGLTINGNTYLRREAADPAWAVVWTQPGNDPRVFDTVEDFNTATGQERYRYESDNGAVTDREGRLLPSQQAAADAVARPLAADVAAAIGRPAGSRRMGSYH